MLSVLIKTIKVFSILKKRGKKPKINKVKKRKGVKWKCGFPFQLIWIFNLLNNSTRKRNRKTKLDTRAQKPPVHTHALEKWIKKKTKNIWKKKIKHSRAFYVLVVHKSHAVLSGLRLCHGESFNLFNLILERFTFHICSWRRVCGA